MSVESIRESSVLVGEHLYPFKEKIEQNRVVLEDASGKKHDFGAFFHGVGKGKVDGMNVQAKIDRDMIELSFLVTHVFRNRLVSILENLPKEEVPFKEIDPRAPSEHIMAYKMSFEGLGTICIGADREYPNFFDRVIVQFDSSRTLPEVSKLLSYVELEDAIEPSSAEDIERLKVGMLFRAFHPREATFLENTSAFYAMPIVELKEAIIRKSPTMQQIFEKYLSKMEARDLLPGKKRYAIPGLAKEVYAAGGRALITAIGRHDPANNDKNFEDALTIWKMGFLAPSLRPEMASIYRFYATAGSDDCVWAQLVTERDVQEKRPLIDFGYFSLIRFLIPLTALEMGTYQYYDAFYGFRNPQFETTSNDPDAKDPTWNDYLERPSILQFTEKLQNTFVQENEVMIKEAARPIKMIVPDQETLDAFMEYIRRRGMIQEFDIFVGKEVTAELLW